MEARRLEVDLITMYKIVSQLGPVEFSSLFTYCKNNNTRGHNKKITIEYNRLNIRKYFFSQRVARVWNRLDESIVHAPLVSAFKKRLSTTNLSEYLVGGFS